MDKRQNQKLVCCNALVVDVKNCAQLECKENRMTREKSRMDERKRAGASRLSKTNKNHSSENHNLNLG
jgi:hypothetical protein